MSELVLGELPRLATRPSRRNLSAYHAAYVALAEALRDGGAPLLTADARFARAARAHGRAEVLLAR